MLTLTGMLTQLPYLVGCRMVTSDSVSTEGVAMPAVVPGRSMPASAGPIRGACPRPCSRVVAVPLPVLW
jgi:hypothetical protein